MAGSLTRTRIGVAGVAILAALAAIASAQPTAAPPTDATIDAVAVDAALAVDAGAPAEALAAVDARVAADAGLAPDAGLAVGATPIVPVPIVPVPVLVPTPPATRRAPATIDEPPLPPVPEGRRSAVVIKLVLGFMVLFGIAYIAGNRRIVNLEERIGLSGIITSGFPFIALGVIVRQPEIGILTGPVLDRVQPIMHFGLGWLGFIIGAQLDIRLLDRVPRGTAYLIVVEALVPFAVTAAACGGLAAVLGLADPRAPEFWRDLVLLATAAAMTAPRRFRGFANRSWREGRSVDLLIGQLDEIVGVVGLLFVAAYFRPDTAAGWQIPGTAWVFVTIGLGVVVGVLIFAMVRVPSSSGEFLAVVLGSVAFGSGLAGYLYLSPIVVCFIAGALVNNFPCEQRDDVFKILNKLERPIHLLFLIVAGASWQVTELLPWVLVPAFVVARIVGKWAGVAGARSTVGFFMPAGFADQRLLVTPLSPLSIALVLSLHASAGPAGSQWIITVVVGGAILTEVAVQLTAVPTARRATQVAGAPAADGTPQAIDDLDALTGPTYVDDDEASAPLLPRAKTRGEP